MQAVDTFKPCLLIPVYNHGAQLPATIEALRSTGLPCLLVDDGSNDETRIIIDALAKNNTWIQARHLPINSGKGFAVLNGIGWANELGFTHALQIDADGQHAINDIPRFLEMAKENPGALISGLPQYDTSVPKARLYGRYVTHVWVWIETLSFSIKDSMCGFRVYPVRETMACADKYNIRQRMDFDTDIMVKMYWEDVPVLFVPTRVIYPDDGVSHFAVWKDNLRISWMHSCLFMGMLPRIFKLLTRHHRVVVNTLDKAWYTKEERGVYWGMQLSLWCYRFLGRRIMDVLSRVIAFYFFVFNTSARQASRIFLQQVYQQPVPWQKIYQHFYNFSDAIVDRVAAWSGDMEVSQIDFPDREKLRNRTSGIVVLTSHLGNVDMCRALCEHSNGKKINVLLHMAGAPAMNRLLKSINPKSQLELISVTDISPATAIHLKDKLAAGEWVVIAADRVAPGNPGRTIEASFLGREASFPAGPFVLAALMENPVYVMFCLKNQGQYAIHVELLAESMPFSRRQRQAALQDAVSGYARLLEKYCKMAPLQWFNFYPFWKS